MRLVHQSISIDIRSELVLSCHHTYGSQSGEQAVERQLNVQMEMATCFTYQNRIVTAV